MTIHSSLRLLPLLLASSAVSSADVFRNGDFEAVPFDAGWSVSQNIAEHPGLVPHSRAAALVVPQSWLNDDRVNLVQNLPPALTYITPPRFNVEGEPARNDFNGTDAVWRIGFYFAVADPGSAAGRSLNVLIGHDTPDPAGSGDFASPQINFRVTGDGAASSFSSADGWQTVFPAGTFQFSSQDGGMFVEPQSYYIQFDGDYISDDPSYRVSVRPANASAFESSSTMRAWQYCDPKPGNGIIRIRFHGVVNSPYVIDEVSPLYEEGTVILLY